MTAASNIENRLTFQKETKTSDGYGGSTSVWADQFTVWGQIIFRTGSETAIAQRLQGLQQATIKVRYSSLAKLIDPSWRIKHMRGDGIIDYYAIKSPAVREADDYGFLMMEAMKGAADGGAG